jgi:outer membrane lipase/esterase
MWFSGHSRRILRELPGLSPIGVKPRGLLHRHARTDAPGRTHTPLRNKSRSRRGRRPNKGMGSVMSLEKALVGRSILAGVALLSLTQASTAQSFNQFIGFGDSTIDSGYFLTHTITGSSTKQNLYNISAASGGGIPTTPGGPMNSQILAGYFGLTAIAYGMPGGTNYAASGAENNSNGLTAFAPPTVSQINTYLASTGGTANPNALYLISSGGNDLAFANQQVNANVWTTAQAKAFVIQAAQDLVTGVTTLYNAGARYIIVSDQYAALTGPGTVLPAPNTRPYFYVQTLWQGLTAAGVPFIPADFRSVQQAVYDNPALFGFTSISNVDGPGGTACINPNPGNGSGGTIANSWALFCTPALLRSPNAAQTSFWADDQHMTPAGQKIEADYFYSLVTAPSQISFLAEVPVKTRASVINAIRNQIPVSLDQGKPDGYSGWVTGDVAFLKLNNAYPYFPSDPGTPVFVTAGLDYRWSREWLVGGALSIGSTRQTFSTGGRFTEDEFAASLYAAYRHAPFWANVIAGWGNMNYDVNRQVQLGITVQPNLGKTIGTNISLALESGYDFRTPLGAAALPGMPLKAPSSAPVVITHGPVVGIVLQQIHVNPFTETAPVSGVTALAFDSQLRNSAVSELGYQASIELDAWKPFVKLAWNHELADINRSVTAALTSALAVSVGAPSYTLPAVQFGRDWGSVTGGTTYKLWNNGTALIAGFAQFAEHGVANYGGQVGLNVSLGSLPPPDAPPKPVTRLN